MESHRKDSIPLSIHDVMASFSRTVTEPEIRLGYLNLTDDNGVRNREYFPGKNEPLWILFSERNRQRYYTASMVRSQIWGSFKLFVAGENIRTGELLNIRCDKEIFRGRYLVHISREFEDDDLPEKEDDKRVEGKGYIYIIRCESAWKGWVKIGETERLPEERLGDYQTYSPKRDYFLDPNHQPIEVPFRLEAEKKAHRMATMLADKVGKGEKTEWFSITDNNLKKIVEVLNILYQ